MPFQGKNFQVLIPNRRIFAFGVKLRWISSSVIKGTCEMGLATFQGITEVKEKCYRKKYNVGGRGNGFNEN